VAREQADDVRREARRQPGEEVHRPGEDSTRSSLALSLKEANRSSHPSASNVEEAPVARVLRWHPVRKFRRHPTSRRLWQGSSSGVRRINV
jgi:hypothetical protein